MQEFCARGLAALWTDVQLQMDMLAISFSSRADRLNGRSERLEVESVVNLSNRLDPTCT